MRSMASVKGVSVESDSALSAAGKGYQITVIDACWIWLSAVIRGRL